ncbi:zinc finger protein 561-like [Uranotaenia lowii]|uniref:zinc finger protein 561-like n=1 Tax=Uranotaenia lowii TaxID=190385 RepID=UPI002479E7D6|nr:zinc finger protein 561-like [Uranotaenia lowii]
MTSEEVRSVLRNDFDTCRFCLEAEVPLRPIYESIPGKASIVSINTTIRTVLNMLGIEVSQDDGFPNLICQNCRQMMISIHKFYETMKQSLDILKKAKLLKEFPDVRFDDGESPATIKSTSPEINDISEPGKSDNDEDEYLEFLPESAVQPEELPLKDEDEQFEMLEETFSEIAAESLVEHADQEVKGEPVEFEEIDWMVDTESDDELEEYIIEEIDETAPSETNSEHQSKKVDSAPTTKIKRTQKRRPHYSRVCPICGIASTSLKVHMLVHTKIRAFQCELCDKNYYTNNKLQTHIKVTHNKIRDFQCEICSKTFAMKKTLNAHLQSHVQDRSHVCSVCKKGFLFKWALTKHSRIHTGEKPYVCDIDGCGKTFTTSSNLKQHQNTNFHANLDTRTDICLECGKTFQNRYALRAHMKTHGKQQPQSSGDDQ